MTELKQGAAFLEKALKTEYNLVREEVGRGKYGRLSCTNPGECFCQINATWEERKAPLGHSVPGQGSAHPHQHISKGPVSFRILLPASFPPAHTWEPCFRKKEQGLSPGGVTEEPPGPAWVPVWELQGGGPTG